ncbi:hypothetical protein A2716_01000 [candidate division WWE3 bacterium RIFCSPHIGHO2_01_FULL_40_23]|uniref:Fibronectin type-III domain-containing protein n=1 Tax=candidate division WWE3 bacterium RIFCSPLOWO2_01_FULL_41_18 TaxID=1802625 RepID=A0A1F4VEF0_UNCKA|nr:MAG: hypothetical protein A2716_01000 [candidate division WWE3 bacterium RIFCSPHIGHO2_01_FULL_40_23]OGC55567.1 MAG: hypothetical protein A3A78_01270 [candidate division WWE3 bacterium RIFCSPLOWO2_01_FULL_41_18]
MNLLGKNSQNKKVSFSIFKLPNALAISLPFLLLLAGIVYAASVFSFEAEEASFPNSDPIDIGTDPNASGRKYIKFKTPTTMPASKKFNYFQDFQIKLSGTMESILYPIRNFQQWKGQFAWQSVKSDANPSVLSSSVFTFTAGGDTDANSEATIVLNNIAASQGAFHLHLGGMSFNTITPEQSWCNYVNFYDYPKNSTPRFPFGFPYEIVSGETEDNGPYGLIDNFASCLPHSGTAFGPLPGGSLYAKEYYFDYAGLARIILISPDLTFGSETYDYSSGAHRTWLTNTIDSARSQNIPWVVVGMHKNCITMGVKSCEISQSLMNLLIEKKVDLVLQGGEHSYQRSKQLAINPNCTGVSANTYNSDCVTEDGLDGELTKDAGTVFVIVGTTGAGFQGVNTSDSEAPYFARWMGNANNVSICNNPTSGCTARKGFLKATVTDTQLVANYVGVTNGNFSDGFTISAPLPTPTPSPTPTPPPDTTPPVVSNGSPTIELPEGTTFTTISATTDENATCRYDSAPDISYPLMRWPFAATGGTSHSSLVTGLEDGTSYTIYVKCADTLGNVNTTDYNFTFSVAAPTCVTLPTNTGTATLILSFDQGTYKVWSRIMSAGDSSNSYYLQVDGGCAMNVSDLNGMPVNTWTWVDYQDGVTSDKTEVTLTAGTHTVKLIGREADTKVDRVIFTSDLACVPNGKGDNCAAPTSSDATAPTVSITSPSNGAIVQRNSSVTIDATASDNVGVTKVEFRANNSALCSDLSAPYSCAWQVGNKPNASYTLSSKAFDAAGNTSTTSITVYSSQ